MEPSRHHGDCSIVRATLDHIRKLKDNLRPHDRLECELLGSSPEDAMKLALTIDLATYTALDSQSRPFAMFGSGIKHEGGGYIWMLGTPDVMKHKRAFIRASREWVKYLTKPFGVTSNVVLKDNRQSVRWLKFCGAKFLRELEISDNTFYEFIIISTD